MATAAQEKELSSNVGTKNPGDENSEKSVRAPDLEFTSPLARSGFVQQARARLSPNGLRPNLLRRFAHGNRYAKMTA